MKAATIESVFHHLRRGTFCLWVGAGVSRYVGRTDEVDIPLWDEVATLLEREVQIVSPPGLECSSRLDVVLRRLERKEFQRMLRQHVQTPLATALLKPKRQNGRVIPEQIRSAARLGLLANPIVNFNIETFSSYALACGGGPWHILPFRAPVPDSGIGSSASEWKTGKDQHKRRFYHPHGAISMTGICVMTQSEYASMRGTLGLQLAVHSAFGLDLAIVGMSLRDRYLREQILSFRNELADIFWFTEVEPEGEMARWVYESGVHVVLVKPDWSDFWSAVPTWFPAPPEKEFVGSWYEMVDACYRELGNPTTEEVNLMAHLSDLKLEDCVDLLYEAQMRGETGVWQPGSKTAISGERQAVYLEGIEEYGKHVRPLQLEKVEGGDGAADAA